MNAPSPEASSPSAWRHLPNAISVLRMVLVLPVAVSIVSQRFHLALWLALAAGLSDALDGWLARHFHWRSKLGSMLDPAADKLLVVTCFVLLAWGGQIPWALTLLVLARDVIISLGALAWQRLIGHFQARPSWISKTCTFMQIAYILLMLLHAAGLHDVPTRLLAWLVAALTLASGLDYVLRWSFMARRQLRRSPRHASQGSPHEH